MDKKKNVSDKKQADQHNKTSKANKGKASTQRQAKKPKCERVDHVADLDWMCYSKGPYEFD